MFTRCKVISRTIEVMHNMTREEWVEEALEAMEDVENLAEVANILFITTVDNKDTMPKTVPTLPLFVSIASLTIMLLRNDLFYKLSGRKRDHRWEIKMSS
jgi:capsid portal protein